MRNRKIIDPLRLGALGVGSTFGIYDAGDTLRYLIPLAGEIERLGYSKFWITEHHGNFEAWSCSEVLLGILAQTTSRISIGAGAVLLSNRNPLKVALDFKCLANLYPNRIDLGIGSGPAGINQQALQAQHPDSHRDRTEVFWEKAKQLKDLLQDKHFRSGPFKGAKVFPDAAEIPRLWVMGLSGGAINHAISLGANYSHGLMFKRTPDSYEEKKHFRSLKSAGRKSLQSNVCVAVVCADTEGKAHKLFNQYRAKIGDEGPAIVGSPEQIRLEFLKLQLDYQIDEIVVRMLIVDPAERLNSFRLLSEVFGLKSGRPPLKTVA